MRILIAHNEYGKPSGEEHAVRAIAGILQSHGHQVNLFLRSSAEIQSTSVKVRAFFSGIYSPKAKREMLATLSESQPDLVQVQNLFPFLSPSILDACRQAGVPVVMRCPNYRLFCPNSLLLSHGKICERCLGGKEYWCVLRNCERSYCKSLGYAVRNAVARISGRILDNVEVFITLSEFQRNRFIDAGLAPDRVEILPNAVPAVNGAPSDGPGELITFVGRASPEKGIEDFVAAARVLPKFPFAVAGATERMPELVRGSPANLRWLGFLNEQALNDAYRQSRIIVMPSRCFEGFPNVITRAMVMAKPVVASRLGPVPEIVEEGNTGLLFQAGCVEDLAQKITALYSDPPRCCQMGEAGKARALALYSPDIVYERLMQIYSKALKR